MSEHKVPLHEEEEAPSLFSNLIDTEPYEKSMRSARNWLYVIAAIQFIMGIVEYNTADDTTVGWIAFGMDAVVAVVFLLLALWSRRNPVPAFTTALISYVLVVAAFGLLDPSNLLRGILLKIFIVAALVKANKDARTYTQMKQSVGEPL